MNKAVNNLKRIFSQAIVTLSSPSQKSWMSLQKNELVSPEVEKSVSRIYCKQLGQEVVVAENENVCLARSLFENLLLETIVTSKMSYGK